MNILIGLIPALFWGIMPMVTTKIGGKPINQIIGTTYGALLTALVTSIFVHPEYTTSIFLWSMLSGAFWAFGQMLQFTAFVQVGVSVAMPVSTGLQLVGTSLMGVLFFGAWDSTTARLIGFSALAIIILGVYLTTIQDKDKIQQDEQNHSMKQGMVTLLIATIGYLGYSAFPQVAHASGWQAFLPQTIGMALAATIFSFIGSNRKDHALRNPLSYKNILTGIVFGIADIGYLTSAQPNVNGLATGFTLSQMNVVISTLTGIWLLGEKKTRKEMIALVFGLLLVVAGGIMTAMI